MAPRRKDKVGSNHPRAAVSVGLARIVSKKKLCYPALRPSTDSEPALSPAEVANGTRHSSSLPYVWWNAE